MSLYQAYLYLKLSENIGLFLKWRVMNNSKACKHVNAKIKINEYMNRKENNRFNKKENCMKDKI